MLADLRVLIDDTCVSPEHELPKFEDPESGLVSGSFFDSYSNSRLPGLSWESGNMFTSTTFMPNCNMEDAAFNDTVWGMGQSGTLNLNREHPVLTHIFYSNAMRRLQAVEQLTLPPECTTIPNTAALSRFEHIWGSVLFVGKMAERHGIDADQRLIYQLRTLLSDMAHTTGSHIGDWLFQGVGEEEDQHDRELAKYLEVVGVADIVRDAGIDLGSVIFPNVVDWVEAPQPDLCVDRVDYALREMNRWNDVVHWLGFSDNDFTITDDNMLAMTDQKRARVFAEGYLLLSQEHWSEPTHRFVEELMMLRVKLFYAQAGSPDMWVFNTPDLPPALLPLHEMHPRDLMYVTDVTQLRSLSRYNLGGNTLDALMRVIAQYRRQYVWPGQRQRIASYMEQFADESRYQDIVKSGSYVPFDSDQFKTYLNEYPPFLPLGFTILDTSEADLSRGEDMIDFVQKPFKVRQINPLVQVGNEFVRLSTLDPSFAQRLAEHRQIMIRTRLARLAVPDVGTRKLLNSIIDNVDHHWQERLDTSRRLDPDELKRLVDASAGEVHGHYPFLTFLSY